jgi:hypothetical protein
MNPAPPVIKTRVSSPLTLQVADLLEIRGFSCRVWRGLGVGRSQPCADLADTQPLVPFPCVSRTISPRVAQTPREHSGESCGSRFGFVPLRQETDAHCPEPLLALAESTAAPRRLFVPVDR